MEAHFGTVSWVSASVCPQPSLLSSNSPFPRAASRHIHQSRLVLLLRTGSCKGRGRRERCSQPPLALNCRTSSCTLIPKCHNKATGLATKEDEQPEQPPPIIFLDIVKIIDPYFCLWGLLTNPIKCPCLVETEQCTPPSLV